MTTIENIKNPVWMAPDHSVVDVTCDLPGSGAKGIPFTIRKGDAYFDDVAAGRYGAPGEYVAPTRDYAILIGRAAAFVIESPYGGRRSSANNYLAQLAAAKAAGTITADQSVDLTSLLNGSAWEQSVLDKRDELLRSADLAAAYQAAFNPLTWPPFPSEAAAIVATC